MTSANAFISGLVPNAYLVLAATGSLAVVWLLVLEATGSSLDDRIPAKKESCLTPTLMDEGQVRNPNTTYSGYKIKFWKFALTWKLICPVQHKLTRKEQKETTKKGGISLTIMGQRQTYSSIHKPQRFNQHDHPYRLCNETGIPEFLELRIRGIPMVVMVTSHARSLRNPTQQYFISACTLPIYICHTHYKF